MIELINVSKNYILGKNKIEALKNVHFKVKEGDFIVIRGPSGSGKSTLLNILGLLDEPTSGEVRLHGKAISFADFDALSETRSKLISFIFQSFNLNPVLTLEENIMIPLMVRSDIGALKQHVHTWIQNVGLETHIHHKPDELSGGQKQRIAIARAMVTKPRLIIADEPTANLDSSTARKILELMRDLNEKEGVAFVFATHDPILDEFAKTKLFMKDGELRS